MRLWILTDTVTSIQLNELTMQIRVFQVARLACGILALVFLALTILIFWRWKIWDAILEETGISKRKSISEMRAINAETGRLIKSSGAKIAEQEFTGETIKEKRRNRRNKRSAELKGAAQAATDMDTVDATTALQTEPEDGGGTSVLEEPAKVVSASQNGFREKFVITKDVRIVHTKEQIGGVS